jgi:tRNA(Arg) A34 adenosine deaminase TadA
MRKFHEAINAATKSTMAEQHGAVVVVGGKTLAVGCNSLQPTHVPEFGMWQHAEMAALLNFNRQRRRYYYQRECKKVHRVRGLCGQDQTGSAWEYSYYEF